MKLVLQDQTKLAASTALIQTPHEASSSSYEPLSFGIFGRFNALLLNSECKSDLLAYDTSLDESRNITQEPPHTATGNRPLEVAPRMCRRWLTYTDASAPTLKVKINHFSICIRQNHTRSYERTAAAEGYGTFAIETSSSPANFPNQGLPKGPLHLVGKSNLQAFLTKLSVTKGLTYTTAAPFGIDVNVFRRPSVAVYAVCLVSRCQAHRSTAPSIQTQHASSRLLYKAARCRRFGGSDASFVNVKYELNLFTHDASLDEGKNVPQKPSHVAALNNPHKTRARSFCVCRLQARSSSPTTNVEINHVAICITKLHPRLRKVASATADDRHRTFALKTPRGPAQFSYRRLLKGALSFVFKTSLQPPSIPFLIARHAIYRTTNPASPHATARSDVQVLRGSPMPIYTVRLIARRQAHLA